MRARDNDAHRPNAAKREYGRAWQVRRRQVLARDPFYRWTDCTKPSTDVDHKIDQCDGGDDSDANLWDLCHSHHSSKTMRRNLSRRLAGRT